MALKMAVVANFQVTQFETPKPRSNEVNDLVSHCIQHAPEHPRSSHGNGHPDDTFLFSPLDGGDFARACGTVLKPNASSQAIQGLISYILL